MAMVVLGACIRQEADVSKTIAGFKLQITNSCVASMLFLRVFGYMRRQRGADLEFIHPTGEPAPKGPKMETRSVASAAGSVAAATIISRILGLVRVMVLARYFGAGRYTDAFIVAYRIPNLLRDLFAEGALSAAFIPAFIRRMTEEGKEQAWALANRVISALLIVLGAMTLVFFFGAKGFVYLLAAKYAAVPEKFDLAVQMTRIMSPFLLCVSLASVGMGLLNSCGRFFIPAMASSAFNICCILAGVFLSPFMHHFGLHPVVSMAIGALIGGISQFLVMMPSAHALGFRFRFILGFQDPGLRHIFHLMLPAIVGLSATQINITVDYQIASIYGDGPVSWLDYAFRLMQFPIGVLGIAIATATMAAVSHFAAQQAQEQVQLTVASSLRLAACLTFPATVGLILFRVEIVRLIYEGGPFLPIHTVRTSQALVFYALGLFSYSSVKILVPAFYALNDTRTPARLSLVSVAAKIGLNLLFIVPLGFLGLACATTAASWVNFWLLLKSFRRRSGGSTYSWEAGAYARIALASLAMGALAWIVFQGSAWMFHGTGFIQLVLRLGLAIMAGIVSIFPLLGLLRVEEGSRLLRRMVTAIGKRV
jgi:putative peptidoglycan lipid II flippase